MGVLLWVQYNVNTCGGAIAVVAVWVFCVGCSTMLMLGWPCSGRSSVGKLLWVQYQFNTSGGAVTVGSDMLLWKQYQFNTIGGAVAVGAVWACCCGCSTMIMLLGAL